MHETINFGIDLGTTNSAIAEYHKGEVTIFKNPINLKQTLSSVVAFKRDRIIIGEKAKELLQKQPHNVFGAFKRKMGTSELYTIGDTSRQIGPIELSSLILKELKNFIQTGDVPEQVVITIPSAFDTIQSNATKEAGLKAGFQHVILLQEPIAASLAFANNSRFSIDEGKWIVYDLGGGTFDVALASLVNGEMKIIDHEGDNFLGGTDIDAAIIDDFIIPSILERADIPNLDQEMKRLSGTYNRLYQKLKFLAEEAKIMLSSSEIAELEFELITPTGEEIEILLELSKQKFEEIVKDVLQKTIVLTQTVLDRQQIDSTDINCILLIGGSTYIPLVKTTLEKEFKIEINNSIDPTTAVAVGAAYFAGTKPKKQLESVSIPMGASDVGVKIAFERVSTKIECPIISVFSGHGGGCQYRVVRKDAGYDSGLIEVREINSLTIRILENAFSDFELKLFDAQGGLILSEEFGITHGKYSVDGQTLPNYICIELDDIEENTTYLEPIFKKNALLPLKKSIVKKLSKSIMKGSEDELIIKVLEGDVATLPSANKTIGVIRIGGDKIERNLIKGTDVELSFEISESRDVKVEVFLTISDEAFGDTFNPNAVNVDTYILRKEVMALQSNVRSKLNTFEREENYEKAALINDIRSELGDILDQLNGLAHDDTTDLKQKLDIRKRDTAKSVYQLNNSSYLDLMIHNYVKYKKYAAKAIQSDLALISDRDAFEEIIANEKKVIKESVPSVIKMKKNKLQNLGDRIYGREKKETNPVEIFLNCRWLKFTDRERADELFRMGDIAVKEQKMSELVTIIGELLSIRKEDDEKPDVQKNDSQTGLE